MHISQVKKLRPYEQHLKALGLVGESSLEALLEIFHLADDELSSYLNVSLSDLHEVINSVQDFATAISQSSLDIIENASYEIGIPKNLALPISITAPVIPTTNAMVSLPQSVNLISQMPPIRDQGNRGTCVAFATLAAYEHYLRSQGATHDLSEQFLYWNCKVNDNHPAISGTWISIAAPLLKRDGCCLENTWQYNPVFMPSNEGQSPPPNKSQIEALSYRAQIIRQLSPTFVQDIKSELASRRCVAFSIPVFRTWWRNKVVADTGNIIMPIPKETQEGGHAMCFVGYEDISNDNDALGGGRFIIRNSWGQAWGINSPYGAGYGTIPYAYIARMGWEAYSFS
jgi:C1A family cysteine protease